MSEVPSARGRFWLPQSVALRGLLFIGLGAVLHLVVGLTVDQPAAGLIVITDADVAALEQAFTRQSGWPVDAEVRRRLVAQEVDDRLLVLEARRRRWHHSDPVIQRRLIQNQRFLGADEATRDAELLDLAYEQGMDRTDVVVKRRMLERMRLAVAEASRRTPIPEADLEAFRVRHLELFRRPARVSLAQIFLSRDRRGESLSADAQALTMRLSDTKPGEDEALSWADPSLLPARVGGASEDELARRFGAGFARAAFAAETGRWTGPIESSFGLHLLRVADRTPASDPSLAEVESTVRARVQREREAEALVRLLEQLRGEARIEIPDGMRLDDTS